VEELTRVEYEQGDRVAWMRVAPLTGDIQMVPATVVGMVDETRWSSASAAASSLRSRSAM